MNKETQILTRLEQLESVIQHNLETIVSSQFETGAALIEIRDQRLYLESFKTFEAYCQERWEMSRPRAYQLIAAAETLNRLSTVVDIKPTKERQVRPLAGLNPNEQRNIWKEAVKDANGKEPTQSQVEVAKAVILNRSVPTNEQDTAKRVKEDIGVAVYHIFEASQREMNRLGTKADQRKFKARLVEYLSKKLIPSTPIPAKRKDKK